MGEIKNRSVRLDDENYAWLAALPGRSLNEAVERLRTAAASGTPFEKRDALAEVLELVRSLPDVTDFEEALRRVIREVGFAAGSPASPGSTTDFAAPVTQDNRPKNCRCRHCGKGFPGPRFATLCSDCKSQGHTLSPNECPRCNEASAL